LVVKEKDKWTNEWIHDVQMHAINIKII
jgi:hypothetical protein